MASDTTMYGLILFLAVLVVVLIYLDNRKKNSREGFVIAPQGAMNDPTTGAIKGPGIMTNGMSNKPWAEMAKEVAETGSTSDGNHVLGVSMGNQFDELYRNHTDIQDIDNRSAQGMQSIEDLTEISKKIASSANNANHNMFSRGGSHPTKLLLAPTEIRGVIDEEFLPERDKNRQIATVQSIIHIPGFNVNTERLGQNLSQAHFSNISRNKSTVRIPTKAGATVGGDGSNGLMRGSGESANQEALDESLNVSGNTLSINTDSAEGGQVVTTSLSGGDESFRLRNGNYAIGNKLVSTTTLTEEHFRPRK
jgi:hypothetical protein